MTERRDIVVGRRAALNAAARTAATARTGGIGAPDALSELRPSRNADEGPGRSLAATEVAARSRHPLKSARGDAEFQPSALLSVESPPSPVHRVVVLTLVALLATALAWSYFGRIASYATAAGKVQALGRTKVLEAQQSGKVIEIRARDGDRVAVGDVVLELDPADARAARDIVVDQRAELRGQNDRRSAEIAAARADPVRIDGAIAWQADVPQRIRDREAEVAKADLARLSGTLATLASQRAAAEVEVRKYSDMIEAQKALVAVTAENSSMADRLQKSGWNSRAKALDLIERQREQEVSLTSFQGKLADAEASVRTIDSTVAKTRESFVSDATDGVAAAERQIEQLDQDLVKAERTLAQMSVRAPAAGVIHASAVTTLGQIVKPMQQLMQIVPEGGPIEIVAFLDNADIGLVRPGQDATVKVDSFSYATYGMIDGTVASVSGDALATVGKSTLQSATLDGTYNEATAAQRTGTLKFQIVVTTKTPFMQVDGRRIALTPGMSVTVDVETEDRRLIDYLASPVIALLSTAAHER